MSVYGLKLANDKGWGTGTVKPLGGTINNKLKLDEHINHVCLKTNIKLSTLMRIKKFLDFNKTRMLFKGFFESLFKYCPLTWMFYSTNTNNKISLLHERALKCELPFEELLGNDGSFTVHHYNIHTLCIELHKGYQKIEQTILVIYYNTYNIHAKSDFFIP